MRRQLRKLLPSGTFQNVSPAQTGRMSAVKGRGNRSTERRLRSALVSSGIRGWLVQPKVSFGRPDFYFPDSKLAVFVDGCFWHGCELCRHNVKTNSAFWKAKLQANMDRDARVNERLSESGIRVIRFWEHELQSGLSRCIQVVRDSIRR